MELKLFLKIPRGGPLPDSPGLPRDLIYKTASRRLAHWIQQDGSFNKATGGCTLCTDSFTKEASSYFSIKYQI